MTNWTHILLTGSRVAQPYWLIISCEVTGRLTVSTEFKLKVPQGLCAEVWSLDSSSTVKRQNPERWSLGKRLDPQDVPLGTSRFWPPFPSLFVLHCKGSHFSCQCLLNNALYCHRHKPQKPLTCSPQVFYYSNRSWLTKIWFRYRNKNMVLTVRLVCKYSQSSFLKVKTFKGYFPGAHCPWTGD